MTPTFLFFHRLPPRLTLNRQPTGVSLWEKYVRSGFIWAAIALSGLLWTCNSHSSADLEQTQADNILLTKAFHAYLNHQEWQAAKVLCGETVRYRGKSTHFVEVDEPRTLFLARYQGRSQANSTSTLEIRQLYPAGAHHVIVEGTTTLPVCLIYTIENNHITRLYAY